MFMLTYKANPSELLPLLAQARTSRPSLAVYTNTEESGRSICHCNSYVMSFRMFDRSCALLSYIYNAFTVFDTGPYCADSFLHHFSFCFFLKVTLSSFSTVRKKDSFTIIFTIH